MPFNLTSEDEVKIISYVTEVQSIGLGSSTTDVRRYAFRIAKKVDERKSLNNVCDFVCYSYPNKECKFSDSDPETCIIYE